MSIGHILVLAAIYALWGIPIYRILNKAGFNPLWSLAVVLPPLGLLILWVLAFARWPVSDDR